ncbi:UNKNOWN [Stylonychia lemnae]|uniref:AMMECR1 domain-containing protein n=1 Tax=Stylonychia lemnae TaxID=5949 RepID=A0A078B8Z7_STYLE|nr:UNKNOWN [Stylonychia lemnae]|eukprot:CDW90028.1 UNKNOWN [Stylonychia lemnae]
MDSQNQLDLKILAAFCFNTLIAKLDKKELPNYPDGLEDPKYPIFVTWTKGPESDLRGCIGTFQGQRLSKILGQYSLISALQDDRFDPISKAEVPELQVGVSLLVNFTSIQDPLAWEVGKHGIEISFEKNGRPYNGTFLPEVAPEQGWDQRETLEYLVRKAGYSKGFESVRDSMRAKTYESLKVKMSFDEYVKFKGL